MIAEPKLNVVFELRCYPNVPKVAVTKEVHISHPLDNCDHIHNIPQTSLRSMTEVIHVDLAVIGIYGIQAARTYLEIHPTQNVIVLEASNSIGGVWSTERMYNDFYTQTPLGLLEFSDQPMHEIPSEEQYYRFFAARHVTTYLERYIDEHQYFGTTLRDRIYLGAAVDSVSKTGSIFSIKSTSRSVDVRSKRVVDATGITSIPNIPDIDSLSIFKGKVLHHKEFGRSNILSDPKVKNIAVIGGAKSAADVAYTGAKAGKSVSWVIRKSGAGPAAFLPAKASAVGPYRNSNESFYTRFTGYFLASYWAPENWISSLLHRTRIGRCLLHKLWGHVDKNAWTIADYDREDGKANGFHNLKPDTSAFWTNESPGILQRDDFFNVVSERVAVHRTDISHAFEDGIILSNGKKVEADAIVFATGWKIAHPYLEPQLAARLGISSSIEESFASMDEQKLRKEVRERFPILGGKPHFYDRSTTAASMCLYNCMVPVEDQNILFLGKMMLGNHFRNAEIQALYAVAVLDSAIRLPTRQAMQLERAQVLAWCKERYLSKGQLGCWFYFDMIPYTDKLLRDLGLTSHRKPNIWKDVFEPCFAKDLRGLIQEYKLKQYR